MFGIKLINQNNTKQYYEKTVSKYKSVLKNKYNKIFKYESEVISIFVEQPNYYQYNEVITKTKENICVIDGLIYNEEKFYYEHYNYSCPSRLMNNLINNEGDKGIAKAHGDFIFVNIKNNEEINFYVPSLSSKQLFVYDNENQNIVVWGSSLEDIIAVSLIQDEISLKYIKQKIIDFENPYSEITPYESVKRIPTGSLYRYKHGEKTQILANKFNVNRDISRLDEKQLINRFYEIFYNSVYSRLKHSSDRVFVKLSGGIDSSLIACMASKIIKDKNMPIELIYKHELHDNIGNELEYAESVAKFTGKKLIVENVMDVGFLSGFSLDDYCPFAEPSQSILGSWKDDNSKFYETSLSGIGGDQLLCTSYSYLKKMLIRGQFKSFYKNIYEYSRKFNVSISKAIADMLIKYSDNRLPMQSLNIFLQHSILSNEILNSFKSNEKKTLYKRIKKYPFDIRNEIASLDIMLMNMQMYDATKYGIKNPFLDFELAEFCFSLPWYMKKTQTDFKIIAKEALKDIIPQEIYNRKYKSDHTMSVTNHFKANSEKLRIIYENSQLIKLNIVDSEKYKKLLNQLQYGNLTYIYEISNLISIDIWLIKNKQNINHN